MRKTMTMTRKRQSGMSLIEVLAGLAIVSVMALGTVTVMSNAHHLTKLTTNKQFATEKAISLIEELKSLVQTNSGSTIVDLDHYDDGVVNKTLLTTVGELDTPQTVKPDDVISGNTLIAPPDTWMYERRINVQKVVGQANDVRLVNVKVFQNTPAGQILLAEVSSVVRTLVDNMPPTQVYDVYALAIENIPGWWVYMSNVVPFVRNAINDLQSRNPGLIFRTHWINTLAYGRDQLYRPFVNNVSDSYADINSVYFYPGKMPAACVSGGLCGDNYYYPWFFFRGRVSVDGTDTNGYDSKTNPYPYALADQYNNAMRYPDELALYTARKSANVNEEMSWRLLMDDMYMNPLKYQNALLINLHGELMPFPPVRNFSDAAKSPGQTLAPNLVGIRAVTHPEQLRYANGDWMTLRVYTYVTDPDNPPNPPNPATGIMPVPLTIRISGLNNWNPSNPAGCLTVAPPVGANTTCDVQAIHGGVDNDSSGAVDAYDAAPVAAASYPVAGKPNQMAWTSSIDAVTGDTILKLYGSPLVSPIEDATGRGLSREDRLYGLEYVPSPVEDLTTGAVQFSTDLTSTTVRPKNTARWIIKIPPGAIPVAVAATGTRLTVETRIGDQLTSGTIYPAAVDPENISRTYTWWGTNTYIFGSGATPAALPLSERYQVLGDPRHCPYADLKRPHVSSPGMFPPVAIVGPPAVARGAYESSLGMGYNRYFNDMEETDSRRANAAAPAATNDRNRGGSAEVTSSKIEPYAIATSGAGQNNIFAVKIDGGATISVALPAGSLTAYTIAKTLNANAVFAAVAVADPPVSPAINLPIFNRVRIASRGRAGSSVQFDTTVVKNCAATVGFTNAVNTTAGWPGWVYSIGAQQYGINNNGNLTDAGWDSGGGSLEIDVHRLFQMLRSALVRSNAIWTTMTGFSYYYIGIGNEIGYDSANNFPNSIPVSTKPFTGASGSQYENTITGNVRLIRANPVVTPSPDTRWWSQPWLGELYPDSSYATWLATGNIPTGVGSNTFVRDNRAKFPPFTGTILTDSWRKTSEKGSTTLFWTGNAGATFHHEYKDGNTAAITAAGSDIANNYSLPVPDTIDNARPFAIDYNQSGYNPEDFLQPGDYPNVYLTKVLNTYYLHSGAPIQGSALISLVDTSTNDPAFIAVNGLSPTGVAGTTFIAKWSFLTLIQSFLNGGLYTDAVSAPNTAKHVRQVPRVIITNPNPNTDLKQKTSITVGWDTTWFRWDGQPYTSDPKYASWVETLTMKYAVIYSPSNGFADAKNGNPTGWFYVKDNSVATPGVKPDAGHEVAVVIAAATTSASVIWNTPPGTFPQGNYLIRVEGYREGWALHYAFHQYRAFFQR
jgi:prepilin-type N-terminal cleavage/methylation domain-containing protein